MRAAITTAYAVFALAITGCDNHAPDEMLPPACRNFQQAMKDRSVNISHHFAAAIEALRGITNLEPRAGCYAQWVDALCKLDIRDLDYIRQAYCIREVLDASRIGDNLVSEYHLSDSWMSLTINSALKGLEWGGAQLDRLKPTMPIGGSYDYGDSNEYSQWWYCYVTAWGCYHKILWNIEGFAFDSLCRGRSVSAAAKEGAKNAIEKFLGRKMRTEAECKRAYDEAMAAINAVHAREVGPDLKNLRSVGSSKK